MPFNLLLKAQQYQQSSSHSILFQCFFGYCPFEGFSKHEARLTPGACVMWYSP